jgi:internalin A
VAGREQHAEAEHRIALALDGRQPAVDLAHLRLTRLPNSLQQLTHVANLDLSGNLLADLPGWFGALSRLTRLDLGRNRLPHIPGPIAGLRQLRFLGLDGNRLSSIPDWIFHLQELQFLSLGENRLTSLPVGLGALPRLTALDLAGNPDLALPREVVQAGTAAVLAFLRARKDGSVPQWRSKVLVVGEGQVGKTSIVKALAGEPHNPAEPTTHGMRIRDLSLQHPERTGVDMALSFWDFGGQDIYHATHQFFLTDRSLFLLVWSPRLGHDHSRVRYWLDIITARAPTARILLVATHCATLRPDLPLQDIRREYPRIVGSLAVDCEPRTGIDELRRAVAGEAGQLPLMGLPWPSAWSQAAAWLQSAAEPYIPTEQLKSMMASAGVIEPAEQGELALVLTHLGEILYYPDDENLADMVVTQPDWLNAHISQVLESTGLVARQGLLTREVIDREWAAVRPEWRSKFIYMMEKYDISYRIEDPAGAAMAVVVERLPWDPPPYESRWDTAEQQKSAAEIRIQYRLSVMPPGIPTWFIARSHRFATEAHWRTGALLQHHDGHHLALVSANREQKTVDLTVRGPMPASFFGMLDDGLNITFDRYPGLRITRLIPCPCLNAIGHTCGEYFEYHKLLRRILQGRDHVLCPESDTRLDIRSMLTGIKPAVRDSEYVNTDIATIMAAIKHGFSEIRSDAELSQLQFIRLQTMLQRQQETRCPSVLTLARTTRGNTLTTPYSLRLYCEQPGEWHPLPGVEGCYPIKEPREWIRRFGPHLRRTLTVLKGATPIAGGLLEVMADELHRQLQNDVKHMKELLKDTPGPAGPPEDPLGELFDLGTPAPRVWAETDADFRLLEARLVELDPSRYWGGLSRIVTPEGQTLFVCRDHYKTYSRRAPMPAIRP